MPEKCYVDEEFSFTCTITNTGDRELDLSMRLDNDRLSDYIWNCKLTYRLGKIAPKNSIFLQLNAIPLKTGFMVNDRKINLLL
jgi:hypothetical protein